MKGILWYVTRKLEGIFDGILMEFRMRISEDKNQTQNSMYIPRFLSSGLYGNCVHPLRSSPKQEQRTHAKTPSLSTIPLHKDANGQPMTNEFNYRSVIGKLNFLEKSTRPDIAYAVHQCARFSADQKQSHADAVKRIGRYLKGTPSVGITLRPDTQQSFQCWVDADFSGNWKPEGAQHDPMTAKSRSGWII